MYMCRIASGLDDELPVMGAVASRGVLLVRRTSHRQDWLPVIGVWVSRGGLLVIRTYHRQPARDGLAVIGPRGSQATRPGTGCL